MQFMQFDKVSASRANSSSKMSPNTYIKAKITQAYAGVNDKGTKFVALSFANQTETADEIKVYYENGNGERLSGFNQLQAIMAFNNISALTQVQGNYKSYDYAQGGVVGKTGLIVPELINAYVGVIFYENWYVSPTDGEAKYTLSLSAVYELKTGRNARQVLENTPANAGQIEQSVEYAKKKSAETKAQAEQGGQAPQGNDWQSYAPQHQGQGQNGFAPPAPQPNFGNQSNPWGQPQPQPQGNFAPPAPQGQGVSDDDMPFWWLFSHFKCGTN